MATIRKALESYKKKVEQNWNNRSGKDESILDYIDYLNMHLPYSNMGKKALAYLMNGVRSQDGNSNVCINAR